MKEDHAFLRRIQGSQILGVVRSHSVVTDRRLEDGGSDTGFTSSELVLLAIGSCAIGTLRKFLLEKEIEISDLQARVQFTKHPSDTHDNVTLRLSSADGFPGDIIDLIKETAISGGVNGRLRDIYAIDVLIDNN